MRVSTPLASPKLSRPKNRRRWFIRRDDEDGDADFSGPDADDDDDASPVGFRPTSAARPAATLGAGQGLLILSKTTAGATLPTAALGNTFLAADPESDSEDSHGETTTLRLVIKTSSTSKVVVTPPLRTVATTTLQTVAATKKSTSETSTSTATPQEFRTVVPAPSPAVTTTSPTRVHTTGEARTVLNPGMADYTSSLSSSTGKSASAETVKPTELATLRQPSQSAVYASAAATTTTGMDVKIPAGEVLGSEAPADSQQQNGMSGGAMAGTVIGALGGISILFLAIFLLLRKLRARGHNLPSLKPLSRRPRSEKHGTGRTTWTWNRNLWGASTSTSPSQSTAPPPSLPARNDREAWRTNSEMLDDLVQATYAAEGNPSDERTRRRQTDLESQRPESPGSFLDENFVNEKAYAALEGPWPLQDTPKGKKGRGKGKEREEKPTGVARWLSGLLTPGASVAAGPKRWLPEGRMATPWQPEPGQIAVGDELKMPKPAFAKSGRMERDTRMTETTATSSLVW